MLTLFRGIERILVTSSGEILSVLEKTLWTTSFKLDCELFIELVDLAREMVEARWDVKELLEFALCRLDWIELDTLLVLMRLDMEPLAELGKFSAGLAEIGDASACLKSVSVMLLRPAYISAVARVSRRGCSFRSRPSAC